jgi:photosystem II stability/assembly factor-like uncharacterized protein
MMTQPSDEELEDNIFQFATSESFSGSLGSTCFMARTSGLYRSEDRGATWQSAYDSLLLQHPLLTTAVAISPDFEHDANVFVGVGGGILRSADGGRNWQIVRVPQPPPIISSLLVSPNYFHDGMIFAGTMEDGVLFSSDRGYSWSAWNFGLLDLNILCMALSPDFSNDETLFVGVQSGIFRSTNGGRAWREVNLSFGYDAVLSLAISPGFAKDGILFAGTETQGLWQSTNGGESWQMIGDSVFINPVNGIWLSSELSDQLEILVLHGGILLASSGDCHSWHVWQAEQMKDKAVTAVLAPLGFKPDRPMLLGFVTGEIQGLNSGNPV